MIGEKLGPFRIEEKLGAGAMGVVYRAVWEPEGKTVAIKVVAAEAAARGNAGERFERESEIMKQFNHPGIVQHIGAGFSKTRGLRYYSMEYVPGITLDQYLQEKGPIPWKKLVDVAIQVAEALQYAHERGVVHRDLKPSNLMLTPDGRVKLADFGIAKDLDRTALTADGRTLGTAAYMAPEQIRGTPEVSHKTDLYALGCVLYQLLTGKTPFEGKTALQLMHKHLEDPPPKASAAVPEIPKALDRLITSLMAKNRDDRPWDAMAVVQTLKDLKEKQAKGEKVAMVYDHLPANPGRLGTFEVGPGVTAPTSPAVETSGAPSAGATRRTRAATRASGTAAAAGRRGEAAEYAGRWRARAEVAGIVLALVGLGSVAAYMLWPPSAQYLIGQARKLMASDELADRQRARDKYLAELDRRFADHPYKEEARGYRDRLLVDSARSKARILDSATLSPLAEIKDNDERAYATASRQARKDDDAFRDIDALRRWQELVNLLGADAQSRESTRSWWLLAQERLKTQTEQIQRRNAMCVADLRRLEVTDRAGNTAGAERIRNEILARDGAYQSVEGLVAGLRDATEEPAPEPTQTP
jgi:serine/threonine-protein kinase